MGKKEGKSKKGRWKIEKWRRKSDKNEERRTFFFFFFFFFAFSFFKTTEVCFGLPKWKFSTGKKHFMLGKNQEKWFLSTQKKFSVMPLNKKPCSHI